jgi:hypothetical protein
MQTRRLRVSDGAWILRSLSRPPALPARIPAIRPPMAPKGGIEIRIPSHSLPFGDHAPPRLV